jgi:PhnB protein
MQTIPDGYTTVTPWLISSDTNRVLEFIRDAFGGEEIDRVYNKDGGIGHAEARVGDAIVLLFDSPIGWSATPAFLRVFVADADVAYRDALVAGATSVTEPTELFWGDKVGRVRDPLGNVWWIQQRVAELSGEEIGQRAGRPELVEARRYVRSSLTSAVR